MPLISKRTPTLSSSLTTSRLDTTQAAPSYRPRFARRLARTTVNTKGTYSVTPGKARASNPGRRSGLSYVPSV